MTTDKETTVSSPTPITVFTGFLGAGKTTTILSLLSNLPKGYKVCLLKNEYGDVEIDSQLAQQQSGESSLAGMKEMINGCLCCVMTGRMRDAVLELKTEYNPDRIFIETSGSAFPAALSIQLRELADELDSQILKGELPSDSSIRLDGIVNMVDVENFNGYDDRSPTAALQAQYTDLIVFNKWELVDDRKFDLVWDRVNDLNTDTPKIKSNKGKVDWSVILGLDSQLGFDPSEHEALDNHHNHQEGDGDEHEAEIETITVKFESDHPDTDYIDSNGLIQFLELAPKDEVYRIKMIVRTVIEGVPGVYIVNWAFGRYTFTRVDESLLSQRGSLVGIGTIMVGRGNGGMWERKLQSGNLNLGWNRVSGYRS